MTHRATVQQLPDAAFALSTLLLNPDNAPLSQRLWTAQDQFGAMFAAGELDRLPDDTLCMLNGLRMFMLDASEAAAELENARPIRRRRKWWASLRDPFGPQPPDAA